MTNPFPPPNNAFALRNIDEQNRRAAEERAQKRALFEFALRNKLDMEKIGRAADFDPKAIDIGTEMVKGLKAQEKQAKEQAQAPQIAGGIARAQDPNAPLAARTQAGLEVSQALAGIQQRAGSAAEPARQTGVNPQTGQPTFAPSQAFAGTQGTLEEIARQVGPAQQGLRAGQAEAQAKLMSPQQKAVEFHIATNPNLSRAQQQILRQTALEAQLLGETSKSERRFARFVRNGRLTQEQADFYEFAAELAAMQGAKGSTFDIEGVGQVHIAGGAGTGPRLAKLVGEIEDIRVTLDAGQQFAAVTTANPQLTGAGSTLFRATAKARGFAQTLAQFTGSTAMLDMMGQGFDRVREQIELGDVKGSEFSKFLADRGLEPTSLLQTDPNEVRDLDVQRLLMSFMAAAATKTGTGRLTVDAVKRWEKAFDFTALEGAEGVAKAVGALNRDLKKRMLSKEREMRSLQGSSSQSALDRALQMGNFPGLGSGLQGVQAPPSPPAATRGPASGAAISVDPSAPPPVPGEIFKPDERGILRLDVP